VIKELGDCGVGDLN